MKPQGMVEQLLAKGKLDGVLDKAGTQLHQQHCLNSGALHRGHWLLTSGKHGEWYICKDAIYADIKAFGHFANSIARGIIRYQAENSNCIIDAITGPAIAGSVLAAPVAIILAKDFAYCEKTSHGGQTYRRGFDSFIKGKHIWIVEDVTTTRGSIGKVIDTAERAGAHVAGVSVMWDRSGMPEELMWNNKQYPFLPVIREHVPSYEPSECPLCASGVPLQDPKVDIVWASARK